MPFTIEQKVLFRHCDPAGIVFFPRYFEMINDATEAFFEWLEYPFEKILAEGGVPTAQIEAQFQNPSYHGDILDIAVSCLKVGRSSADMKFQATCRDQLRFLAHSTLVHTGTTGRSAAWPESLQTSLRQSRER
ncbi:acyl-CoA thioesterase [Pacificimonas sp. WHA3]|uniref:Acyl-CoA thioesterase n=1 Tax=Pacificimonas pallii TaxID=2827236 RepID=A0ABS6SAJ4_9SPHN|nr:acyl-CoA thioesterase [Pacificimonas pallii]MBV7255340.1 acyl-CoA thioesterase [Pacificimonas pallii]